MTFLNKKISVKDLKNDPEKKSSEGQVFCKNFQMSNPHTKLTLFQISSVVAGFVGG